MEEKIDVVMDPLPRSELGNDGRDNAGKSSASLHVQCLPAREGISLGVWYSRCKAVFADWGVIDSRVQRNMLVAAMSPADQSVY